MANLTKGMTTKETQKWIAEKRSRVNTMSWEELNEFNREMELLEQEWSSRRGVKVYRHLKGIAIWIGVAFIVIGGIGYKVLE